MRLKLGKKIKIGVNWNWSNWLVYICCCYTGSINTTGNFIYWHDKWYQCNKTGKRKQVERGWQRPNGSGRCVMVLNWPKWSCYWLVSLERMDWWYCSIPLLHHSSNQLTIPSHTHTLETDTYGNEEMHTNTQTTRDLAYTQFLSFTAKLSLITSAIKSI